MTLKNFTPVADNKVVNDGDPAADMNNTSDELAAMGGTYNVLNANYAGGADATGTNDSTRRSAPRSPLRRRRACR